MAKHLLYNPTMTKEELLASIQAHPSFRYCVIGLERGESDTPHFQGCVELKNSIRTNAQNKLLPNAHSEARHGTAKEADVYCQKGTQSKSEWQKLQWLGPTVGNEADFVTAGVRSCNQSCRSDLQDVVDLTKTGASLRQVACSFQEHFILHHRGIARYMRLIEKPRAQVNEVVVYYGSTGTGKSKHMRRMINEEDLYIWHPQQECWFHGYDRHVACLFEEFRGQLSWSFVL